MKFKVNKVSECPDLLYLTGILSEIIAKKGNELVSSDENSNFVLNVIDLDKPKAFRRKSQEEMVVSITLIKDPVSDIKASCYVALVKSISNMLFCISMQEGKEHLKAYSITPEVGFIEFSYDPDIMYKYMYPVISSHFVLRNRLFDDLQLNEDEISETCVLLTKKDMEKLQKYINTQLK